MNLNNRKAIPFYLAVIVVLLILINGCAATKIVDAEPVALISAEKVKHSSNWIVCVQSKDGSRHSFKHNSHCYRCESVSIVEKWNRVVMANGQSFFEPVK